MMRMKIINIELIKWLNQRNRIECIKLSNSHSTTYVTVNRNHYIKDDKKLRYIPQISNAMIDNLNMDLYDDMNDSDTEFEEQEDILLDYIYENLELDDENIINNLQKIFI